MTVSGRTTMSALQWQLANDAARRYEEVLVPAYLGPAARVVVARADLQPGEAVLDVGCGTGAAARAALAAVGPTGRVVGVDVNRYMIHVARDVARGTSATTGDLDFREGDARQLPLRDHGFDAVLCANTLQFVPERARAVRQMVRVLRPGGRAAVGTWELIEANPYFEALAGAISASMGTQVVTPLTSACTLGTPEELWGSLTGGGLCDVVVDRVPIDVVLPPLATFIPRHVSATPMAAAFRGAGDEAVADVVRSVATALGRGTNVEVPVTFHLLVGRGAAPV